MGHPWEKVQLQVSQGRNHTLGYDPSTRTHYRDSGESPPTWKRLPHTNPVLLEHLQGTWDAESADSTGGETDLRFSKEERAEFRIRRQSTQLTHKSTGIFL